MEHGVKLVDWMCCDGEINLPMFRDFLALIVNKSDDFPAYIVEISGFSSSNSEKRANTWPI